MSYNPTLPPSSTQALPDYVFDELSKVAEAMQGVEFVKLQVYNNPPARPRTGQVVFADGTDWDPGAGRGYYGYDEATATWVKLG